jgi:hypothetical protein
MNNLKTKKILYPALLVLLMIITAYMQIKHHKFEATWFGINIYAWALCLGGAIALGMMFLFKWIYNTFGSGYGNSTFRPNVLVFLLLSVSCWGSSLLGVHLTEAKPEWKASNPQASHDDHYHHSHFYYFWNNNFGGASSGGGSGIGSGSSSSDGAEGLAILVLALVLILILILSATVQHFWVVGSISIIFMMAKFTIDLFDDDISESDTLFDQSW